MKKTGTFKTYKASDMCSSPANTTGFRDPGNIHEVLLTDLKPSTTYYYQFGSDMGMSSLTTFRTAPVPNADETFKFLVYGDMGVSPNPRARLTAEYCLDEVNNNNASFVVHIGDISYAEGQAYIWDQWAAFVESYATRIPYMVNIGNHEYDHDHGGEKDPSGAPGQGFHPWFAHEMFHTDSGGECGVPMFYRFHMPDTGHSLWWYSFNYGSVHVIMISTEHDFSPSSPQYKWIEKDLRNVNRSVTPWVLISGHRPMYSSQSFILLQCFGATVLQCFGTSVLRCFGVSVLRCYRCFSATVLQCYGASVLRCSSASVPSVLLSFNAIQRLPQYGASVLRCFSATVLQCFGAFSASMLYSAYRSTALQCYGASVLRCFSASVPSVLYSAYRSTVLQCYGASVLRCFSATVLQCFGAFSASVLYSAYRSTVLQCYGASVFRCLQCFNAIQCLPQYGASVLRCYGASVLRCFSVSVPSVLQCYTALTAVRRFSATVLQCYGASVPSVLYSAYRSTVLQCFSVSVPSVLQCYTALTAVRRFSATVLQCYGASVLRCLQCFSAIQCLPQYGASVLRCFSVSVPSVLQCYTVLTAVRRFSATVLQCYGASVLRCFSVSVPSVLQCYTALTAVRCINATVLQCYGASVLRCFSASVPSVLRCLQCYTVLYSAYRRDYMLSRGMQHFMEDMIHKYQVDLGLWAHYHSYERTCPVFKSKCTKGGTIHITVGTAGKEFDNLPYMDMDWSMFREIEWGYGRITVL
ncbi:hypothetical protein QZH41_009742, partial [Actinostola sp. cb2023]